MKHKSSSTTRVLLLLTTILLLTGIASAEYSVDITGLKNDEYNTGEEINFKIIALENEDLATGTATVTITDALKTTEITKELNVNEDQRIIIQEEYPSGLWNIKIAFKEATVERTFIVGENTEIEFLLEGEELIIRNKGNTRYTKTVTIEIGGEKNSYAQNIRVGEEKRLQLLSPTGTYDITITDGKNTIRRQNVQLTGTGNVIGAIDKELVGYTGFAGAGDLRPGSEQTISLAKVPGSMIFIGAVMILGILVYVERKLAKKKKR